MKLKDKKTIFAEKNNDRKREIEEGVKLAKSIDSLRESLAKEQANLKSFRDATTRSIKEEIESLMVQRSTLVSEVSVLEEKRKASLEPITKQQEDLLKLKEELDLREDAVNTRDRMNSLQEISLQEDKELIEEANVKIKNTVSYLIDKQKLIDLKTEEAQSVLDNSREQLEIVNTIHEHELKEIKTKELSLQTKESNISLRVDSLDRREKYLNDFERRINDKYQTLLRTEERVKQKNG